MKIFCSYEMNQNSYWVGNKFPIQLLLNIYKKNCVKTLFPSQYLPDIFKIKTFYFIHILKNISPNFGTLTCSFSICINIFFPDLHEISMHYIFFCNVFYLQVLNANSYISFIILLMILFLYSMKILTHKFNKKRISILACFIFRGYICKKNSDLHN